MSNRFQVTFGRTTYAIEDRDAGVPPYVKLSRFRALDGDQVAERAEFFVLTSLVVAYVMARMTPKIRRLLADLAGAVVDDVVGVVDTDCGGGSA